MYVPSFYLTHIPIPALSSTGVHTPSSSHMITCENSDAVGCRVHGVTRRSWKWVQAKLLRQRSLGSQVPRVESNVEGKSLISRTPCREKCGWRRIRTRSSEAWWRTEACVALVFMLAQPCSVLPGSSQSLSSTQHPSLVLYPWSL